jgi:DNA-binding response OmpR family regulator
MKILVAEDDHLTRRGLGELLGSEGYEVVLAVDGKEALELFASERPDLVWLDLMMPKKSGYEVLRSIRQENARVPILIVSAKGEELDKVLGLELGADDFIVKPFGAREVAARIKAALRRAYPAADDEGAFSIGDLEVRPAELRAWRDGAPIDLSPREAKMLALLAERRGKVVDRPSFFRCCWDLGEMPQTRTLDQHVAQLRKKIERDPKKPVIIETVQGVGYRTP